MENYARSKTLVFISVFYQQCYQKYCISSFFIKSFLSTSATYLVTQKTRAAKSEITLLLMSSYLSQHSCNKKRKRLERKETQTEQCKFFRKSMHIISRVATLINDASQLVTVVGRCYVPMGVASPIRTANLLNVSIYPKREVVWSPSASPATRVVTVKLLTFNYALTSQKDFGLTSSARQWPFQHHRADEDLRKIAR